MTRIRKTYSYFCKKRPQKDLSFACVYFRKEKLWKVCPGKLHTTGRFRYIYNGIEGIANKYDVKCKQGAKPAELQKLVIDMNKKNLEAMFPKPYSHRIWNYLNLPPLVIGAIEEDLTIED